MRAEWGILCNRFPRFAAALATFLAVAVSAASAQTPTAGQNVNMVSGTRWPGGDPFLQRQNEPSIAISSRNSLHLLAGANDYRTVDLPVSDVVPGSLSGDAWLGVFKSFDGGQTWWSTLHPGYPQDKSAEGAASPLKAYSGAADPTVRAGTNGLFYYSGIVFNRGTNIGAVFVSTFLDANQKENGDPTQGRDTIKRVNTVIVDTGNSGQFLDKTWIAVDVARAGAATCTFNPLGTPQSFPAGNVYLVWSRFTGSTSTKIMFSRSLDCGKTWSQPIKLSESSSINQGTNLAIDPKNGDVYAVWRRFATSSQTDAIVVAKSTDLGKTFPSKNTVQVASITPFDQSTTSTRFRTSALPSIAVSADSSGVSRPHVAWAQRDPITGDARIVVSTSNDGGATWGAPVAVDSAPLSDNPPAPYSSSNFSRGHQFMPQLTFAAGRLMVLYYDQRLDHTLGFHFPYNPFVPDAQGNFYRVLQKSEGEGPGLVFPTGLFSTIDDANLTTRRHTIDLRVAEAFPGASPAFTSTSVSQYRIGLRAVDDPDRPAGSLEQLQDNPPNLPMFSQGTVPFLGDYVDIAGQTFQANSDGSYSFNTSRSSPPTFYATWTDNRDVKPPLDGNWGHYTPVGGGGPSVLDPSQSTPPCVNGQEGMRNQNIYSSLVTDGLLVGSPQTAKPLSPTLQRAFIVTLQNSTSASRTFRMAITSPQPLGGQASFLQASLSTQLDVSIDAHSGVARPVFVTSSNPAASVTVNVSEIGANSIGLSGFVVLNPEGTVSPLAQPDGSTVDIGSLEIYTPSFAVWNTANANPYVNLTDPNQNISNQNISNQNISNADPAIQNISNQNISNQNISNQNISNVDPALQNISNQNISNATYADQNISNQNISNQNISNATITDATYAVTNSGNTTHSYRLALYGNNPHNIPLQLIVTKNSSTPTSVNCTLVSLPQTVVASNVDSPVIAPSLAAATNPALTDPSLSNGTVSIAPGETVFLTLRGLATAEEMTQLVQQLTPVVTAHGAISGSNAFAALLFIQTSNGGTLPAAIAGTAYTTNLQAAGGTGPLTWIVISGTLPPGLTLSAAGVLSGTPTAAGTFAFTAKVSDSSPVPQTATQAFQITVSARSTGTAVTVSPNPVAAGSSATVSVTVTDTEASGTKSSPSGTVALSSTVGTDVFSPAASCTLVAGSPGSSSCTATVSGSALGPRTISAAYPGSSVHGASGGMAPLTIEGNTTTTITSDSPAPSVLGSTITVAFTVAAVSPAAGTPTGAVTVTDGVGGSCSTALVSGAGSCSFVPAAAGTLTLKATYPGDGTFFGSVGMRQHTVLVFYSFTGFFSPLTTAGTLSSPSNSGTGNFTKGLPIKWQLKDSSGNFVTDLTSTQTLKAVYYTGGACTAGAATGTEFLLYQPTSGATGGSTFRYDSSNNQFLFNWSTKAVTTGAGCYELELQLNDGSPLKATQILLQ